nr:glycosyltransferase family 4 protein [uncultured Flavobacterium sp.]
MSKPKLIRITTVPISLEKLLTGQLRFMSSFYDVIAISSDKKQLEKVGAKEAVATFPLEMSRKITPVKDVVAVFKLFLFLKREKPLIVHTHTPKAGIVGMLAAKLAGVPHRFHTVAGLPLLETKGLKRKVLDFVEKLTYACATNVYPNSKGLLTIILENSYCAADKIKVLANGSSNGIDTSYFNPTLYSESQNASLRAQLNINHDDFVFVFVGRLVGDKGINELASAFELLLKDQKNAKLLLVGDYESDLDPLSAETMAIIQSNKAIITVGFQSDVRPYLAISDALVFPSYREGFPNVVMQAGAMGLPSIVTDINGCNEIIIHGENGIIIPVKNATAILAAMQSLMSHPNSPQKRALIRAMIVNRYEQQLVWEAILDEYQRSDKNNYAC